MRSVALVRPLSSFALVSAVALCVASCSSNSNRFEREAFSSSTRPAEDLPGAAPVRSQPSPQVSSAPLAPPPAAAQAAPPVSALPAPKMAAIPPAKAPATPLVSNVAPPAASAPTYVVASGDTLHKIARQHHVTAVDLAAANKIAPGAKLKPGSQLVIPPAAPLKVAQAKPVQPPKLNPTPPSDNNPTIQKITPTPNLTESKESAQDGLMFRWPVRGRVTDPYGPNPRGQENHGINISVPEGTPVKAAEDGVVLYANNELKSYGNLVLIRHNNGFVSTYAHCSEILVKKDDIVKRGQVIAKSGQTGNVKSPQLHFEIRKGKTPVDPMPYLERSPQA